MNRSKKTIVASSDGINPTGAHVVTPTSMIAYVEEGDSRVFVSRMADDVCFLMNSLWSRKFSDVSLPIERIFEHVPLNPVLIRHWVKPDSMSVGGLLFPRSPMDRESLVPSIQILKSTVGTKAPKHSIQTDLTLSVFRRELLLPDFLQPFDQGVWNNESYAMWKYFHADFAPMFQEECNASGSSRLPTGACTLFRRMMHTHYDDCGLIFGSMWWKFGLGEMVAESIHDFMRRMLIDMFMAYNVRPIPPALPPLFNAVIQGSDQRVCAGCMTFRLGTGQMRRCPCQQVYYCSVACQLANWKVHRVICGRAKSAR